VALELRADLRRLGSGLLISFLAIVVTAVVLELGAAVWEAIMANGRNGWTLVASRRLDLVSYGEGDQLYYLFEPDKKYRWEGIDVEINSYGIRGPEISEDMGSDQFRILNLGDSIPFGWEVEFEEIYGQVLEQSLQLSNPDVEVGVITVAVPGWTPTMAHNYLLDQGLALEPDLVILAVTVVNDIYGSGPQVSRDGSVTDWLRDNTHAWPVLTTQARLLLARTLDPRFLPVLNPPRSAQAYYPLDEDDPRWASLLDPVVDIQQACEELGIPFLVVIFPTAMQVNEEAHPDLPQQMLEDLGLQLEMQVVDLLPAYRQECSRVGPEKCTGLENHLFADVWMHPSNIGHELAAQALSSAVSPTISSTR
jgi:hypothetical protein